MQIDTQFDLYKYAEFAKHTKVINLNQIEHFLWLKIPDYVADTCTLYRVDEVATELIEISYYLDFIERDGKKPWLRVQTDMINKSEGFHQYKFSFVNTETNDIVALYFSYNIQNDNPTKPYQYMKERNPREVEKDFLNMDDGSRYERRQ